MLGTFATPLGHGSRKVKPISPTPPWTCKIWGLEAGVANGRQGGKPPEMSTYNNEATMGKSLSHLILGHRSIGVAQSPIYCATGFSSCLDQSQHIASCFLLAPIRYNGRLLSDQTSPLWWHGNGEQQRFRDQPSCHSSTIGAWRRGVDPVLVSTIYGYR